MHPRHAACGTVRGSQADKDAMNSDQSTPLAMAILEFPSHVVQDLEKFEEHMMCFRKFLDLGRSVNPEGDSLLALAV